MSCGHKIIQVQILFFKIKFSTSIMSIVNAIYLIYKFFTWLNEEFNNIPVSKIDWNHQY